jgi:hypothetical protein
MSIIEEHTDTLEHDLEFSNLSEEALALSLITHAEWWVLPSLKEDLNLLDV